MSSRHGDRPLSVYPIIGLGLLTLTVRVDVMYTPQPLPRGQPKEPGGRPTGTPRRWCVHWAVAAGSWQNGGSLCPWFEELYERFKEIGNVRG